jgi:hypothetical protein
MVAPDFAPQFAFGPGYDFERLFKVSLVARPMPLALPVTNATFPSSLIFAIAVLIIHLFASWSDQHLIDSRGKFGPEDQIANTRSARKNVPRA